MIQMSKPNLYVITALLFLSGLQIAQASEAVNYTLDDLLIVNDKVQAQPLHLESQTALQEGSSLASASSRSEAQKPPPLPVHTLFGVGGGAIVPMAYLVNPGPEGTSIGNPSFSITGVKAGRKNVQTVAYTQTFLERFEIGYAVSRFGLGNLPEAIGRATTIDINRDDVYLHNFNLRTMLVEENSYNLPLPAITVGVHFKVNEGIRSIDNRLGGALDGLGFSKSNGTDFTLTSTKMFEELFFGRPLIATCGLRFSQGAQMGYLGFSDAYRATIEASLIGFLSDNLLVAYEYRQKKNPYRQLGDLVGQENDWHTVCLAYVVDEHLTIAGVWGHLGNVINGEEDSAWGLQLKYEF